MLPAERTSATIANASAVVVLLDPVVCCDAADRERIRCACSRCQGKDRRRRIRVGILGRDQFDPPDDLARGIGLQRLEHELSGFVGDRASRDFEVLVLSWLDAGPVAVQVTSVTIWLTGPSSVCTGVASDWVCTTEDHPGIGKTSTVRSGRLVGKNTWAFTVLALSRSLGTRKVSSTSLEPAGNVLGWTVM